MWDVLCSHYRYLPTKPPISLAAVVVLLLQLRCVCAGVLPEKVFQFEIVGLQYLCDLLHCNENFHIPFYFKFPLDEKERLHRQICFQKYNQFHIEFNFNVTHFSDYLVFLTRIAIMSSFKFHYSKI